MFGWKKVDVKPVVIANNTIQHIALLLFNFLFFMCVITRYCHNETTCDSYFERHRPPVYKPGIPGITSGVFYGEYDVVALCSCAPQILLVAFRNDKTGRKRKYPGVMYLCILFGYFLFRSGLEDQYNSRCLPVNIRQPVQLLLV